MCDESVSVCPQGRNHRTGEEPSAMNIGIRGLLLLVAVVLFVIAIFSDVHQLDLIAVGLACTAGAFLVGELGITGRIGSGTRR
jgi:hypothetical protein